MDQSLLVTVLTVIKLFLISLCGFLLVRLKLVSRHGLDDISNLILYVSMPALVFFNMIEHLNLNLMREFAVIPIGAVALTALACLVAFLGALISSPAPERRYLYYTMIMFGNAAYLPIPLVMTILPQPLAGEAVILIFLFVLIHTPLLWSLGLYFVVHEKGLKIPLRRLVSPPLIAIMAGALCALIPSVRGFLKDGGRFLLDGTRMVGDITVPLVMMLLGGIIGTLEFEAKTLHPALGFIIRVFIMRMLVLPAAAIVLLVLIPLPPLARFVLALEAMSPPATNIVVMARTYRRPTEFISLAQLVTYLMAIITLPVFIYIVTRVLPMG